MRRHQARSMKPFTAGLLAIVLISVGTYLAFTKEVPFRGHYEIEAVFRTANDMRPGSAVRIAGVDVGEVTDVRPAAEGAEAAIVRMRIDDKGLPIHKDAEMKIRPRILFEGNFFVDVKPGSPSLPTLGDGDRIPINQTAAPVQLGQVLEILKTDTRTDLRRLLRELDTALEDGGARAFRRSTKHWADAYRSSAIVNEAWLGLRRHDLSGYVDGAGRVAEALDRNPEQLKSLITDLKVTAAAFAERDEDLSAAIAELPRTLRVGQPALKALNDALPPLRRFTADLRPAVRSSGPAIDAQIPFVRQLRGLVQPEELRGLTADLRPTVPDLARLNDRTIPFLEQMRALSSCQNQVIVPWSNDTVPDKAFPSPGPVYQEQPKGLVGLAGESRTFDANGQWFRVALNTSQVATPFTGNRFLLTDRPLVGANPGKPHQRSPLRPDVACETQEPPDLRSNPQAPPQGFEIQPAGATPEGRARQAKAVDAAVKWLRRQLDKHGNDTTKVSDQLLQSKADLQKIIGSLER